MRVVFANMNLKNRRHRTYNQIPFAEVKALLDLRRPKSAWDVADALDYTQDYITHVMGKLIKRGEVYRHKAIKPEGGGWFFVYTLGPDPIMSGWLGEPFKDADFGPLAKCYNGYSFQPTKE